MIVRTYTMKLNFQVPLESIFNFERNSRQVSLEKNNVWGDNFATAAT